ncbi:MAG: SRPBCC domain-containing protein [Ignavibacteriae bacterium]|nr:SRPBCC domain-containing protein [Ignavibacteriota bacterium]NOG99380.1 SRPBCC domain-containing protein [Ignavibacteriota bacterium]
MQTLHYSVKINASIQNVWNTMLEKDSYKKWASAFSAESQYEGEWKQGNYINFFDPNMGGTKAVLEIVDSPNKILAKHVAILSKDGVEDTESEIAKKWIGAEEKYTFSETDGVTELNIEIKTHEDFAQMFDEGWDKALVLLKDLCE